MSSKPGFRSALARLLSDYGMVLVLLLLCAYFSWATYGKQSSGGRPAGEELAARISKRFGAGVRVLIVARSTQEDREFAAALREKVAAAGGRVVETVTGQPVDAREAMERAAAADGLDVIAANEATAAWPVFEDLGRKLPALKDAVVLAPESYRFPAFLKSDNLLNVANQIAVIAILAVGMTLVIITGGIDLSVGSLIALGAVVTTLLIRNFAGGEQAGVLGMTSSAGAAILLCGAAGLATGILVTAFHIPPFIVTLAMMLVTSGLAYLLSQGQSVYQVPDSFVWLGRGADLGGVPNAVLLTLLLYGAAHVLTTRTALGRSVYAVGSNREAARLSGIPVWRVLLFVYTVSGLLAGLGGVVTASQLKSGAPTYGQMYELYVIAAAVVGGTSLQGGQGRVLGTLIGAFIIAVIQNGMNLTGVESYTQKVVLGMVILGAVLLDTLKQRGWSLKHRAA
ncbi:MAG: ABC transporter permease [Actinomycetota bacterium]